MAGRFGAARAWIAVIAGGAAALSAGSASAADVRIRYTSYGIPHVLADTFEGVGFGLGHAFARDNLCIGLELALTLAGERSQTFGEDGNYVDPHLGATPVRNLESDFYARFVYTDQVVASMRRQLSSDAQALVTGYVRGFNHYVAETPSARRPAPCRTADWLRPLTEEDVYRRINQVAVLQGTHVFLRAIAAAQPPQPTAEAHRTARAPAALTIAHGGSNMAAFGRKATQNGRGLSYTQPHFPWDGPQRFYAAHLTVPGEYDVFGGLLYGTPFIILGFNRDVGWGITYSTNHRLSLYRLKLASGAPTSFVSSGRTHQLESVEITVPVRTTTGLTAVRSRTLYRTPDGPVIDNSTFPWTREYAFTLKDANRDLGRWPDQFLALGRAPTARDVKEAGLRIRGMMFSNVAAADRHGNALYINFSPSINMPDADFARCLVADGERILRDHYLVVFDGARTDCGWRSDGDAVQPDLLPARRLPWIQRDDYVLHANDSHWLVNADPKSALEGFDRVVGRERYPLGDRTRTGLRLVEGRLAGADGLGGNLMSLESLRRLLYRAETVIGETIRDDIVRDCRSNPTFELSEQRIAVDLRAACDALHAWNGSARADARGGALARELVELLPREPRSSGWSLVESSWRVPFDRTRPIETPAGLVPTDATRRSLAQAALSLQTAGIAADAPLREIQFLKLDGQRVALGGFTHTFLRFSPALPAPRLKSEPIYTSGDSYIHAVTWDEHGPVADVALAYSQSTDPESQHSWDLTLAYAQQRWIRLPFLDRDIQADPGYRLVELASDK